MKSLKIILLNFLFIISITWAMPNSSSSVLVEIGATNNAETPLKLKAVYDLDLKFFWGENLQTSRTEWGELEFNEKAKLFKKLKKGEVYNFTFSPKNNPNLFICVYLNFTRVFSCWRPEIDNFPRYELFDISLEKPYPLLLVKLDKFNKQKGINLNLKANYNLTVEFIEKLYTETRKKPIRLLLLKQLKGGEVFNFNFLPKGSDNLMLELCVSSNLVNRKECWGLEFSNKQPRKHLLMPPAYELLPIQEPKENILFKLVK